MPQRSTCPIRKAVNRPGLLRSRSNRPRRTAGGFSFSGDPTSGSPTLSRPIDEQPPHYSTHNFCQAGFRLDFRLFATCNRPLQSACVTCTPSRTRSEEHTSELQSRTLTSYAVFCLKKNTSTSDTNSLHTLHSPHNKPPPTHTS